MDGGDARTQGIYPLVRRHFRGVRRGRPPKNATKIRSILRKHGLTFKSIRVGNDMLFLVLAIGPLRPPELYEVGRWHDVVSLQGLADTYADADALRRYEQQAERAEQRRPWFYW